MRVNIPVCAASFRLSETRSLIVPRTCDTCGSNQCVAANDSNGATTSSVHGVSGGAVAGAVIASLIFLAVVIVAFLWYRRRQRQRSTATPTDGKKDAVARAEEVLNRPDPNEKPTTPTTGTDSAHTVRIFGGSNTTINLDPESQGDSIAATHGHNQARASTQSNPFADSHSIQSVSTGTQSNVIPIHLVPPGSVSLRSDPSSQSSASGPARPVRTPEMDLNINGSTPVPEPLRSANGNYAKSTRSGLRNSYMTTGSYASDVMSEAPVIITPSRGAIQVARIERAEVIRTPPTSTQPSLYSPDSADSPKSGASLTVAGTRPVIRSPLASSSFGPTEEDSGDHEQVPGQDVTVRANPFGDEHSPYPSSRLMPPSEHSPAASTATFGGEQWDPQSPRQPWAKSSKAAKHSSVNTQAGSIIGATISAAHRVHVGLDQYSPGQDPNALSAPSTSGSDVPHTPVSAAMATPRSMHRMTSAKLIATPTTGNDMTPTTPSGVLERQQRYAIEELESSRMVDRSSVVSAASTRADSILEGFPFVPPSPISDRPMRTPPRSPLAQQAFSTGAPSPTAASSRSGSGSPLPAPPNRKLLGMSTASQSSTMSNGLGSFPFQIDSGNGPEPADNPSSMGRQRASLDTLALTSDLSSYPLGFDKNEAMANYPGPSNGR